MKLALTLTAASVIAFSSFASAGQELSMTEMDIVSAGGSAAADALADAFGNVTSTSTNTQADVVSVQKIPGQLGAIYWITSTGVAQSASDSDAKAISTAQAAGVTAGSLLSDTSSMSTTTTDSVAALPSALAMSSNTSNASTILLGNPASSSSASNAASLLQN